MSLRRNIFANYVSQFFVTLIGIIMVPIYVRYMGLEAYGLVGFFAMMQAWFQLLDMGLTPTMTRETARYQGGAADALGLWRLLRTLEAIFIGVALLGASAVMAGSGVIADKWLKVQQLPMAEVQYAIIFMAIIVALRWVSGLYRGVINGFERLVWLSTFNIAISTVRFVFVIPIFVFVGASPINFFSYQLAVAVLETAFLIVQTYRLMPSVELSRRVSWQWGPLRKVLKFSISIAFASIVGILTTQTDKLLLSKLLPLTDYAYFTLAVLVASGVIIISGPISGALLPRLTKLSAEGDEIALIQLYRNATQIVSVIAIPVSLVLAFFAEQVLWAWTGDFVIAHKASPILSLYALGNCFLALAAFPYYLQFAKGDLKLHLLGNLLFVLLLIPALILATWRYGMIGSGWAWVVSNAVAFFVWVPIVHRHFVKGMHLSWLLRDIGLILFVALIFSALAQYQINWPNSRITTAFGIAGLSSFILAVSATSSSCIRGIIIRKIRKSNTL